jgi:hypothetical protein
MHKYTIALIAAVLVGSAAGSSARAEGLQTVLLGNGGWEAFAGATAGGSLAWSGEDETFTASPTLLGPPRSAVEFDEHAIDVALLTGLPAPEPPALVLAGMAFGGVLCGRTLLMRRRARNESALQDHQS